MKRLASLGALALAVFGAPAAADASILTIRDDASIGGGEYVPNLADTVEVNYKGEIIAAGTGPFALEYQEDDSGFWTAFLSFCLQFDQSLNLPNEYERVAPADYFADAATADIIGILYANFMTEELGLRDLKTAAAVQLVIWEVVEDGAGSAFDLTAGMFQVLEQEAIDNANALWAIVTSGQYEASDFVVFRSEGSQDQLSLIPTPIPGAMILLLSGLAALRAASKRRATA